MDLIHAMNELAAGIGMKPVEADETGGFTLLFDGVQEISFAPDGNYVVFHAPVGEAAHLDREGLLSLLEASRLGAGTGGRRSGCTGPPGSWCSGSGTGSFRGARTWRRPSGSSWGWSSSGSAGWRRGTPPPRPRPPSRRARPFSAAVFCRCERARRRFRRFAPGRCNPRPVRVYAVRNESVFPANQEPP